MLLYSVAIGILPGVLFGHHITSIEWWVIVIPLNIVGNAILSIAYR